MINRSVVRNVSAQAFSQFVTIFIQIGMVPVLLTNWGAEKFGVWVALTAVSSYLSFSDFGLTFVAKNDMLIRYLRGAKEDVLVTFQSVFVVLTMILTTILFVSYFVLYKIDFQAVDFFVNLNISKNEFSEVLLLQIASVVLYQIILLLLSGVRCIGRSATESLFAAFVRLGEALGIAWVALTGGGILMASFAALLSKLLLLVFIVIWLRRNVPWIKIGYRYFQFYRLKELGGASLSYLLIPLSNVLTIQGPLIVLASALGPLAVAIYSVTRTVARVGTSISNMLIYAITPEYTKRFAVASSGGVKSLASIHNMLIFVFSVFYVMGAYFFGQSIIAVISKSNVEFDGLLYGFLVLSVIFEMYWTTIFSPIASINKHKNISVYIFIGSIASIALGYIYSTLIGFGLVGILLNGGLVIVVGFLSLKYDSFKMVGVR